MAKRQITGIVSDPAHRGKDLFDPRSHQSSNVRILPQQPQKTLRDGENKLTEQSYVVYDYALPRHLQGAPSDLVATLTQKALHKFTRMNIVVIHSANFSDILKELALGADVYFT